MYGFIHSCLEDLVTKKFGKDVWEEIIANADVNLDGGKYLIHKKYSDCETMHLITATQQITGIHSNKLLELFGQHFFYYCYQSGYDRILKVLGRSLPDVLRNLDTLHDHLATTYPGINAPSFRVTERPDGSIDLHYYSNRVGLEYIVIGIVKTVSKEYLNIDIDIRVITEKDETHDHIIFNIKDKASSKLPHLSSLICYSPKLTSKTRKGVNPQQSCMSICSFASAFPFHFVFDRNMNIKQCGTMIKSYLDRISVKLHKNRSKSCVERVSFFDAFYLARPKLKFSFDTVLSHINTVFVVSLRCSINPKTDLKEELSDCQESTYINFRLKGQMIYLPNIKSILFLCSPRVSNINELRNEGLYLSDIPLHDIARQLLVTTHSGQEKRELVKRFENSTNNLKILKSKLVQKKKITDDLLHELLPKQVATQLRLNKPVPSENYSMVSVISSDLVGFTALCSNDFVVPMDIIKLLNQLYTIFDEISVIHEVYKIETVGDAYIGVSGIPTQCSDHADKVAYMACEMLSSISEIKSPVESIPIQIRIGLHSGPVMAAVVGKKMPRYCLFGRTVTIGNKMESLSTSGKINISIETKRFLSEEKWIFEENTSSSFCECYYLERSDKNRNTVKNAVSSRNINVCDGTSDCYSDGERGNRRSFLEGTS